MLPRAAFLDVRRRVEHERASVGKRRDLGAAAHRDGAGASGRDQAVGFALLLFIVTPHRSGRTKDGSRLRIRRARRCTGSRTACGDGASAGANWRGTDDGRLILWGAATHPPWRSRRSNQGWRCWRLPPRPPTFAQPIKRLGACRRLVGKQCARTRSPSREAQVP
jgi:hypothetical protein